MATRGITEGGGLAAASIVLPASTQQNAPKSAAGRTDDVWLSSMKSAYNGASGVVIIRYTIA